MIETERKKQQEQYVKMEELMVQAHKKGLDRELEEERRWQKLLQQKEEEHERNYNNMSEQLQRKMQDLQEKEKRETSRLNERSKDSSLTGTGRFAANEMPTLAVSMNATERLSDASRHCGAQFTSDGVSRMLTLQGSAYNTQEVET